MRKKSENKLIFMKRGFLFFMIIFSLTMVFAGDVVVKEGSLNVDEGVSVGSNNGFWQFNLNDTGVTAAGFQNENLFGVIGIYDNFYSIFETGKQFVVSSSADYEISSEATDIFSVNETQTKVLIGDFYVNDTSDICVEGGNCLSSVTSSSGSCAIGSCENITYQNNRNYANISFSNSSQNIFRIDGDNKFQIDFGALTFPVESELRINEYPVWIRGDLNPASLTLAYLSASEDDDEIGAISFKGGSEGETATYGALGAYVISNSSGDQYGEVCIEGISAGEDSDLACFGSEDDEGNPIYYTLMGGDPTADLEISGTDEKDTSATGVVYYQGHWAGYSTGGQGYDSGDVVFGSADGSEAADGNSDGGNAGDTYIAAGLGGEESGTGNSGADGEIIIGANPEGDTFDTIMKGYANIQDDLRVSDEENNTVFYIDTNTSNVAVGRFPSPEDIDSRFDVYRSDGESSRLDVHTEGKETQYSSSRIRLMTANATSGAEMAIGEETWLGALSFLGHTGTEYRSGAQIRAISETFFSEGDYSTRLEFAVRNSDLELLTPLILKSSGYVGILTDSPTHELSVNGSADITNDLHVNGNLYTNSSVGLTGNFTNGNCWQYFEQGILKSTNCTEI